MEGYEQFTDEPTSDDAMAKLSQLAEEQLRREVAVEEAEAALERAKKELADVAEGSLPGLMKELKLTEFKTENGRKIAIDEQVHTNITEANKPAAFGWLRASGNGKLIKNEYKLNFGKGEEEQAKKLQAVLDEGEFEYDSKSSVHHSTLKAFVKNRLAEGEELPLDLFGVHRRSVSKVSV